MVTRAFLALSVAAFSTALSFGSMANTPGAPWEQTSTLSQSVQVVLNEGFGSGGLFSRSIITRDGVDYLKLCFASADHVTSASTFKEVRFEASGVTLTAAQADVVQILGRGHDGNQDLSFLGMQFRVDRFLQRDPGAFSILNGMDGLALGVYDRATMGNVTSHGYGRSAFYLSENGVRVGFLWREDIETLPGRAGLHRFVNHTVTDFAVKSPFGGYTYDAVVWKTSDRPGEGQINSGDSGGVLAHGSSSTFVGVNTYAVGRTGRTAAGLAFEEFLYGWEGGALGFTQADVDWLNQSCADFEAVPEPATMTLLGLAALVVARRKRRVA